MYFYAVPPSEFSKIENMHLMAFVYVSFIICSWRPADCISLA